MMVHFTPPKVSWTPVKKIVAAALSGLSTTAVVGVLDLVHVHVDQSLAGLIVAVAAVAAGYLVPGSQPAPDAPAAPQAPEPTVPPSHP